ncbi:MAG: DUF473 domain-containing protein [Methanoregulaceae archaeon]|jgi:hypothetical protein
MKCPALTSISPDILKELKAGRPRTIEIQSTHNIITLANIIPGPDSHLFMTSIDMEDLAPGDTGICVYVLGVHISMKRIVEFMHGLHYEERERMSARVQVKYCASSVVKSVHHEGIIQPTSVDVLKSSCYHAG